MNTSMLDTDMPVPGPFCTDDITRGVCRYLRNLGYSPLTEFKLISKRRVDVIGLNGKGRFIIIEIKSSVSDFRADTKWHEYPPYGDQFYFCVANGFPVEILPKGCWAIRQLIKKTESKVPTIRLQKRSCLTAGSRRRPSAARPTRRRLCRSRARR